MASIVHFLFHLQNNIKLYHWTTTSFARHKAADELVSAFIDLGDKFMEVYIGKYGRNQLHKRDASIQLQHLDDKNVVKLLEDGIRFLLNDLPKSLKKEDVDLYNLRDEMVATLNQTKYLFTLQ